MAAVIKRTQTASPMKLKDDELKFCRSSKQATFKLNKDTILIWRRILLIRYFQILGGETNVTVKWTDYDVKSRLITCNDEKRKYEWKLPVAELFKSATHVSTDSKRRFVVTLFYSTHTALVQGQGVEEWINEEYTKINNVVQDIIKSKGDNSVRVDKLIANIDFDTDFLSLKPEKVTTKEVVDVIPPMEDEKESNETEIHQTENDEKENTKTEEKRDEQHQEIEKLKTALHAMEAYQIENDEKITKLLSMCDQMTNVITGLSTEVTTLKKELIQVKQEVQMLRKDIQTNTKSLKDSPPMESTGVQATDTFTTEEDVDIWDTPQTRREEIRAENNVHVNLARRVGRFDREPMFDTNSHRKKDTFVQQESNRTKSYDHDKPRVDVWIIGTSIVKDLHARKMYASKKVRITTLRDKTIKGATELIESGKVSAKNILLQVGSNDLDNDSVKVDDVIEEMETLVDTCKKVMPHTNVVLSEILPRFYSDINMLTEYDQKRLEYNSNLREYASEIGLNIVKFDKMYANLFYDGIHLDEPGVRVYVSKVKQILNPMLGIDHEISKSDMPNFRQENYRKLNYSPQPHKSENDSFLYKQNRNNHMYGRQNNRNRYMYGRQVDGTDSYRYDEMYNRRDDYNFDGQKSFVNSDKGGNRYESQNMQKENMFRLFEYMLSQSGAM